MTYLNSGRVFYLHEGTATLSNSFKISWPFNISLAVLNILYVKHHMLRFLSNLSLEIAEKNMVPAGFLFIVRCTKMALYYLKIWHSGVMLCRSLCKKQTLIDWK